MKQLLVSVGLMAFLYSSSQTTHSVSVAINQPEDCTLNVIEEAIHIYPNPASQFITIEMDVIRLGLFDMSGKAVQFSYDDQNKIMDVRSVDDGIYLLRILSDGEERIVKIKISNR